MSKTIYVAADHGGYDLKNQIVDHLSDKHSVEDLGPAKLQLDDDYPDYVLKLVESMRADSSAVGVLACRSAEGVSIAANRNSWIRAAVVTEMEQAIKAREHNDANVICLSGDLVTPERNIKLLESFLATDFSDEPRHKRRIDKIERYFPL